MSELHNIIFWEGCILIQTMYKIQSECHDGDDDDDDMIGYTH